MTEPQRIADELRRSLSGPAWHGSALSEVLADVTEEQANQRPINAHTIHETVLHLVTWIELASGALRGEAIPEWPFPEDWPSPEGREWSLSLERLMTAIERLVQAAHGLNEDALSSIAPGRDYSIYFLLHGISQHHAYHGGQIALIKKAFQPRTS